MLSWGSNSFGQLGLGKGIQSQPRPALIYHLTGVAVSQVSAGATHTMVLTLPGLVYCCGANQSGQLGLNRVDEKGTDTRLLTQLCKSWLKHVCIQLNRSISSTHSDLLNISCHVNREFQCLHGPCPQASGCDFHKLRGGTHCRVNDGTSFCTTFSKTQAPSHLSEHCWGFSEWRGFHLWRGPPWTAGTQFHSR